MPKYEGEIYIRPVYRGVILAEIGENGVDIEDWLSEALGEPHASLGGWSGRVRIMVEKLPDLARDTTTSP